MYTYRDDLRRWDKVHLWRIAGQTTEYYLSAIPSAGSQSWVPALLTEDPDLRPGEVAGYLALAVLADAEQQADPEAARDGAEWRRYGTECVASNAEVMRIGGFTTWRQSDKYRKSSRAKRHVVWDRAPRVAMQYIGGSRPPWVATLPPWRRELLSFRSWPT